MALYSEFLVVPQEGFIHSIRTLYHKEVCKNYIEFFCRSKGSMCSMCIYRTFRKYLLKNITELLKNIFRNISNPLKLVSAIFYQNFIYQQIIALQKLWKILFISSKKLFSFSRYWHFCIFVFPFVPLSAIALEVDSRKILSLWCHQLSK